MEELFNYTGAGAFATTKRGIAAEDHRAMRDMWVDGRSVQSIAMALRVSMADVAAYVSGLPQRRREAYRPPPSRPKPPVVFNHGTEAPEWPMRRVAREVAAAYGLTLADLQGPDQTIRMAHPRQEAMAKLYALGVYSMPQIGEFFNRHHTTVLHSVRKYQERQAAALARMEMAA